MSSRPQPFPPAMPGASAEAFGQSIGETVQAAAALSLPFDELARLQSDYMTQATELWNRALTLPAEGGAKPSDRRFSGQEWVENPMASYVASMYLLNARTLLEMAETLEGDEKTRQRVRFAVQQWIDAASPANYLALNPEAQRRALETGGESIGQGLRHLLRDVQQGHLSQTDETLFEVGINVATTEGSVVFENELFQLIEYKPLTKEVYERPLLIVPPCINKFYILDLQPENSLVRHALQQGHRVFLLSWVNADESLGDKTWDDYIEEAAILAIRKVQALSKQEQINTLGFCIGGTILATALAVLAARGEHPAASMTLLTTMLDFTNTGVIDLFVDEASVQLREMSIGKGGLLKGSELATTFSFLRPNDLVWNYVVGNYLKGETPPPFDLLYWNSDGTNLPGPMFCWYLRNTYLENNLVEPRKVTVCGEPLDLGLIQASAFIYASREDHIVPWESAYASTRALKGKKHFVLGASGHIAGVINPPEKKKRSYWVSNRLPAQSADWLTGATETPGSWWPEWFTWLKPQAGKLIAAPKTPGDRRHKPIEAAPGRYVQRKA